MRGNVDTRLRKLAEGECDALVLARGRARAARALAMRSTACSTSWCRPRARARWRSRRVPGSVAPGCRADRRRRTGVRARRARAHARARRVVQHAGRRAARGCSRGGELELTAWVGRPTARPGSATVCAARPRGLGLARWPSGCLPPGPAEMLCVTVYLVGAGPGDPGSDDGPGARADRGGRRDRLRPADPAGRARRGAGGRGADLRRQGGRRAVDGPGRDRRVCWSSTGGSGRDGGPPEGRRSVRVRPRRRGGRGAAGGRDAVRGRARASPPAWPPRPTPASRSPTATPRARWRSSPATRTRTSRVGVFGGLGGAGGAFPGRSWSTWASGSSSRSPSG